MQTPQIDDARWITKQRSHAAYFEYMQQLEAQLVPRGQQLRQQQQQQQQQTLVPDRQQQLEQLDKQLTYQVTGNYGRVTRRVGV